MRGHLPALDHGRMDPASARYMIRINGHLGATMLSAFPALALQHHGSHTVLTGLLDQSALHGVQAEIEALGLDLLEIRKLTPDRKSPEPGDSRSQRRLRPSGASVSLRGGAAHDQCPGARSARYRDRARVPGQAGESPGSGDGRSPARSLDCKGDLGRWLSRARRPQHAARRRRRPRPRPAPASQRPSVPA